MLRLPPAARIAILVAIVLALAAAAQLSGLAGAITRERLQTLAQAWGVLGLVAYVAIFAVGELLQLPGMLFVVAAVAAYGPWAGTLVAYVGMNVASWAVFVFARAIAGRALGDIAHPRVKALMTEVEDSPIRAVMFARGVLFVLPGVGYALALSPLRFRDYAIGSAIGLVVPVVLAAVLGEWLLRMLGG